VTTRLQFGTFIFDAESRELRGPMGPVHLSPKAFALLDALLESRPRAMSKAELHDRLWAKTFVSDSNLARLVAELRRALGDPPRRPVLVRTVHGFGYGFCGTVVVASREVAGGRTASGCRLVCGPREFLLTLGEHTLGRVGDAAVWIESTTVSRRHARVVVSAEGVTIEDLGSKNGTYLCGRKLAGPAPLADGDEIRLGSVQMTFRFADVCATETDTGRPSEA
jgi:DNA-binding winged helix-turn-helix (wHTH) protein